MAWLHSELWDDTIPQPNTSSPAPASISDCLPCTDAALPEWYSFTCRRMTFLAAGMG